MSSALSLSELIEAKCRSISMDVEEVLVHARAVTDQNHVAWSAILDAEEGMCAALRSLRMARNEIEAKAKLQAAE